jgi:hypothetical protein
MFGGAGEGRRGEDEAGDKGDGQGQGGEFLQHDRVVRRMRLLGGGAPDCAALP